MEKYGHSIRGGKQDSSTGAKRLMHFLNTFNGGAWCARLKWEAGVPEGCPGSVTLRIPAAEQCIDDILGSKPPTLSALADDVANSICDGKTRDKFQKFVNLLIEKVEKK